MGKMLLAMSSTLGLIVLVPEVGGWRVRGCQIVRQDSGPVFNSSPSLGNGGLHRHTDARR